jgi:Protein of unknown function (DUF4235)
VADKRRDIGTRVVSGLAAMAAAFVMRKLITAVWTKATGKEPPTHPEDPQVALSEALGWAVITGVGAEAARLLATRAATRRVQARHPESLGSAVYAALGGALPADKLAIAFFGKLAPVMHKEAARASELIRLPWYHPERELLIRQVRAWQLQRFSNVIWIKIDGAR